MLMTNPRPLESPVSLVVQSGVKMHTQFPLNNGLEISICTFSPPQQDLKKTLDAFKTRQSWLSNSFSNPAAGREMEIGSVDR